MAKNDVMLIVSAVTALGAVPFPKSFVTGAGGLVFFRLRFTPPFAGFAEVRAESLRKTRRDPDAAPGSHRHLLPEFDHAVVRQAVELARVRREARHEDVEPVLPYGHADIRARHEFPSTEKE